jgi:hypothetical protein
LASRVSTFITDLRIHDVRHEAISRLAETGKVSVQDLQTFSGHRDLRMLTRYSHLCASRLAKKLDECFADKDQVRKHRGRRYLSKKAAVSMSDVVADAEGNSAESITLLLGLKARDVEADQAPATNIFVLPPRHIAI